MKKFLKNVLWGFGGQILSLGISFLLPRFVLLAFGSEVNGITATVTQIFVYLALLEGGIGNASKNRLYADIAREDRQGICLTVSATRKYYFRCMPLYVLCVGLFALGYPLMIHTTVPASTVRGIILIQAAVGVINFCFTNTYMQLLAAEGRNYVYTNLTTLEKLLSVSLQLVLIQLGFDIVRLQLAVLLACALKAVLINGYVRRTYPWLCPVKGADTGLLKNRFSFIVHEVSMVIFQGTDVFLISAFCSIREASVYAIYSMIYSALNNLVNVLFHGMDYTLGEQYHKDLEQYRKLHDLYDILYSAFVFGVISAAFVLTLPFVRLYTQGVTDADYLRPSLPLLFALIQLLSCSRAVASKLITVSGRVKQTIPNTLTETAINLVASLVLVNVLGMPGVLLGTILALLYRTNDMILYANRKVLGRSPLGAYKTMGVNLLVFCAVAAFGWLCPIPVESYLSFVCWGAVILPASLTLCFGAHWLTSPLLRRELAHWAGKLRRS